MNIFDIGISVIIGIVFPNINISFIDMFQTDISRFDTLNTDTFRLL